jgi:hypothetical protein
MAAAITNNEQKRHRIRGDVNARFEVIELLLFLLYMARRPAIAGRRVDRELVLLSVLLNLNSIQQCQFQALT